jgi:branched-chain amino acid transport system permease protein
MGRVALTLAAGAVCLVGPLWLDGYSMLLAWTFLLQGVLALSYHLVGGLTGEMHLGHGLFFGLGAYAAALVMQAGCPWTAAVVLAGGVGAVAALCAAPLLVPLTGPAFSLVSLALLLGAKVLAANLGPITGGIAGLVLAEPLPMASALRFTVVLFFLTLWSHHRLLASRPGRALRAVAADPVAAAGSGVAAGRLRLQILTAASTLAGMAGGIYPGAMAYLSPPSAFGLEVALNPLTAVVVGGVGNRWGPLLGTVFVVGLQEYLWTRGWQASLAVMGGALILVGWACPRGLAGLLSTGRFRSKD